MAETDPSGVSLGGIIPQGQVDFQALDVKTNYQAFLMALVNADMLSLCIQISYRVYKENNTNCLWYTNDKYFYSALLHKVTENVGKRKKDQTLLCLYRKK